MMISIANRQLVSSLGGVTVHLLGEFQVEDYFGLVELEDLFAGQNVNQLIDWDIHVFGEIIVGCRSIQKRFFNKIKSFLNLAGVLQITNSQF
jgi:hypothetical protein